MSEQKIQFTIKIPLLLSILLVTLCFGAQIAPAQTTEQKTADNSIVGSDIHAIPASNTAATLRMAILLKF